MSLAEAKSEPAAALKYKRVLLKISGEALMGDGQYGIDQATCERFAKEVLDARQAGAEICLVIGGGNIFRGMAGRGQGHGARQRRLYGHAGHGDERARHAERASSRSAAIRACCRPFRW